MGQGLFTKVKQVRLLLAARAETSVCNRTLRIWLYLMDVPRVPPGVLHARPVASAVHRSGS